MKVKHSFLICFCICLTVIHGCKPGSKQKKESIVKHNTEVKINKTYHSFGNVKEGEIVGCYFEVANTGNYPLVINKVKPGCGCTAVKYTQKPILPGKVGEVEVRFNSKGFKGKQYKVVQVYANIEKKKKELVITANVVN